MKMHFIASSTEAAVTAAERLSERYGHVPLREAEVIVALGGDGLMLSVMHQNRGLPVYGMNRGTVGFLMNSYSEAGLPARIAAAEETAVNPLAMTAGTTDGHEHAPGHQ
ncbi:NAD(+)/NADH kinase [Paracoccus mutanolyticus]|uniref:NAD(+)/NADH kinase n=1 Tax=Paracoccus mutanolyticus TaxID=1499308 RepID=UPI001CB8DE20